MKERMKMQVLLCCAVLCCAVLCCAVLCCAVLCCAVHEARLTVSCCTSCDAQPDFCLQAATYEAIKLFVIAHSEKPHVGHHKQMQPGANSNACSKTCQLDSCDIHEHAECTGVTCSIEGFECLGLDEP